MIGLFKQKVTVMSLKYSDTSVLWSTNIMEQVLGSIGRGLCVLWGQNNVFGHYLFDIFKYPSF